MAGKLVKKQGAETLTFEVTFEMFDLDLEDNELAEMARDPRVFLANLLDAEGQVVNDVLVAADEKFMSTEELMGGTSVVSPTPPHPPTVWHCVSPPAMKSKWITIVQ